MVFGVDVGEDVACAEDEHAEQDRDCPFNSAHSTNAVPLGRPDREGGLNAALRTLAARPFGAIILWVVGAGLVTYGIFCFARARYAKV